MCTHWHHSGYCESHKAWMHKHCETACEVCDLPHATFSIRFGDYKTHDLWNFVGFVINREGDVVARINPTFVDEYKNYTMRVIERQLYLPPKDRKPVRKD